MEIGGDIGAGKGDLFSFCLLKLRAVLFHQNLWQACSRCSSCLGHTWITLRQAQTSREVDCVLNLIYMWFLKGHGCQTEHCYGPGSREAPVVNYLFSLQANLCHLFVTSENKACKALIQGQEHVLAAGCFFFLPS